MEIELPDGTVLDAPEGADIKSVVRGYRLSQLRAKNPAEYDPASQEYQQRYGTNPTKTESFASGIQRGVMGTGNLLSKMQPNGPLAGAIAAMRANPGVSNEAIQQRDAADVAAKQAHPVARIGGEVAGTLPIAMATGGAGSAPAGASALTRTLASPYLNAALQGGLSGASTAPIGEQGSGAAKGAALGTAMQGLFGLGGRALNGIIQKSKEMQDLEQIFGQHGEKIQPPISQAAGDQDVVTRLGKSFYQEALPLIPGVKGKLERQAQEALEKTRELALKEATPTGMSLAEGSGAKAGEAIHGIRAGLKTEMEDILDNVTPRTNDLVDDVRAAISQAHPKMDDTSLGNIIDDVDQLVARFSNGASRIEGSNMMHVVTELERKAAKAPPFERDGYEIAANHVKSILQRDLNVQGAGQRFSDIQEPLRHFKGLEEAVNAARVKGGNFSMADLARKAKDPAQLDLAATANSVLSQPATKASLTGRILAGAGIGGFGAYMSPVAAGGALLGGNIMATKAFQRAMMGDTAAQEALKLFLSQHPELAAQVASAMKTGAASQVQ